MRDSAYADRQDERLAELRRAFAAQLLTWMADNGLSTVALERLSKAASGRARISTAQINRLKRALTENYHWHPQQGWFVALAELNELIVALSQGAPAPEGVNPAVCAALQPLRNAAGDPMDLRDFVSVFFGLSAWPERTIDRREDVGRLCTRLPEVVEKLVVEAGRSLLADLDELLSEYPGDRDRLRAILYRQATPTAEEMDRILPALAYALRQFTGRSWSRDALLDRVGNGNGNGLAVQMS